MRRSKAPSPFPESGPHQPTDDSESESAHAEETSPPQAQSPKPTRVRKPRKAKAKRHAREATPDEAVPVPSQPTLDSDSDGPPPSAQPRGERGRRDSDRPPSVSMNGEHVAQPSDAPHEEAPPDDMKKGGFGPGDDMQVDSENVAEPFRTTLSRHPVATASSDREDEPVPGSRAPSPASTPQPGDGDEANIDNANQDEPVANNDNADQDEPVNHVPAPTPAPAEPSAQTPETRRRSKRKVKRPSFSLQEEQNANAFAELPLNDAASPGRSRGAKSATPAKPTRTPRRKRKKPDERADAVADAAGSNDERSTGKSQYRSGPLSRTEQNQITRAVDRVRDAEGLSQEDMNRVIHDNPRNSTQAIHRQLWASIQDACPSRPRKKLMSWTRQRFHNFAGRGTWTPVQDDELLDLIEKHGKKWSHIAGLINRYQKDVRDRWRNYLVCRETVKTDAWSKDEEARFRTLVENSVNQIRQGPGADSKKSPETLINWLQISEAMGHTRSRLQCMEKWKRMRAADPLPDEVPTVLPQGNSRSLDKSRRDLRKLTADVKYVLIRAVRDSAVESDADINWTKIVNVTFDDRYERQALVVAWGRLRQSVPDWEGKTTLDCALHLCEMYEREGGFGAEKSGEVGGGPEDDRVDGTASSVRKRGRKDKAADRPSSSSHPTPSTLQQQARATSPPAASAEPRPKRPRTQRKTTAAATADIPPTESQAEPQVMDTGMEDQTTTQLRVSSNEEGAEQQPGKEQSPEPVPHPPSAAEADPPRVGGRERRASVHTKATTAGVLQQQEEEGLPRPSQRSVLAKRWPTGYVAHGGDDMGEVGSKKKRRTSNTQEASETNAKRAKLLNGGVPQSPQMSGKAWSVSSSDMDDMDDIPATIPAYRARQRR